MSAGFEAVRNQFDAYLLADPAYSAQLGVYWNGELVVDLTGGPDLAQDSVTGVFMEELARRITGRTLQETYESELRGPHDIDFYLGLPAAAEPRFREVLPMAPTSELSTPARSRRSRSSRSAALTEC